jgi:hypothetical protein
LARNAAHPHEQQGDEQAAADDRKQPADDQALAEGAEEQRDRGGKVSGALVHAIGNTRLPVLEIAPRPEHMVQLVRTRRLVEID